MMTRKIAEFRRSPRRGTRGGTGRGVLGGAGVALSAVVLAASPLDALLLYWIFLLLLLLFVLSLMRPRADREGAPSPETDPEAYLPTALPEWRQSPGVRQVLDVKLATTQRGIEVYQGRLLRAPQEAFAFLRRYFAPLHKLPQLEEVEGGRVQLVVIPEPEMVRQTPRPRLWLHWGLFLATFVTMTFAGGIQEGFNLIEEPGRVGEALPYSVGLLMILAFHEFGHYFMARRYGMNVTPPFFIPVPFGGIGTFGAFIQLRSPSERRRNLFDVAIAGPLAGLVVAIPALFLGLMQSRMLPVPPEKSLFLGLGPLESPLLMDWLARAALGEAYLPGGYLDLSPLARAGYLGLLLTMLNLLPIGQLDGGHIAHAMFGARTARMIGSLTLMIMFAVGVLLPVPALVTWALIVYFIAGVRDVPPLDDITPIDSRRRALGALAFLILLTIATPSPQRIDAGRDMDNPARRGGAAPGAPAGGHAPQAPPSVSPSPQPTQPRPYTPAYRYYRQTPAPGRTSSPPAAPTPVRNKTTPKEEPKGLGLDWT